MGELQHDCPDDAEELCEAMDWNHLAVAGPGVDNPLCKLVGFESARLHPKLQLGFEIPGGPVRQDDECDPVDEFNQEAFFLAVGVDKGTKLDTDDIQSKVKSLEKITNHGAANSAYFLALTGAPASLVFSDLCAASHKIRAFKHVRGLPDVKDCGEIEDDFTLADLQDISRSTTTNVLFHHLWKGAPLHLPSETFDPSEYHNYVWRAIEDGNVIDAVGRLKPGTSPDS